MEDTDSSDLVSGKNDICTSLREELWVFIVSMRLQVEIFVQSSSDLGHHLAQAPVDHFERGLSVQLHNANLSEVDATSVSCHVDLSTVRDLENLLRNLLVLVGVENIEQTWDKSSSDLLVLDGFWVCELDGLFKISFVSQVLVVLLDGHKSACETLDVTLLGQLVSHQISKLVFWDESSDSVGWRIHHWNVVESIADTDFFSDVTSVKDIWSNCGDLKLHKLGGI